MVQSLRKQRRPAGWNQLPDQPPGSRLSFTLRRTNKAGVAENGSAVSVGAARRAGSTVPGPARGQDEGVHVQADGEAGEGEGVFGDLLPAS